MDINNAPNEYLQVAPLTKHRMYPTRLCCKASYIGNALPLVCKVTCQKIRNMSVKLEIDFVKLSESKDARDKDSELDWEKTDSQCQYCREFFEDIDDLGQHIYKKHCKYECSQCKKRYFKESLLKKHLRHAHLPRLNIKCKFCDKEFSTKYNLQQHLMTHSSEPIFKCPFDECDKKFRHVSSLKQHEAVHQQRNRKECPICHEHVTKLSSHILSHVSKKPFKCDECDKQFTTTACLENHKFSSHFNGAFLCEDCGASYKNLGSLHKHKRTKHMNDSFDCPEPQCPKKFNRKDNLIVHARKYHKIDLNKGIKFAKLQLKS